MISRSDVLACHKALTPERRTYWHNRKVTDDILDTLSIGYVKIYGWEWFAIPILDFHGECLFLKLKRPPGAPEEQPKGMVFPRGSEATLYPLPYLHEKVGTVVLCEGEPDCLTLLSHGIEAVCSTGGAGAFDERWAELFPKNSSVITCYDMDKAGKDGERKVISILQKSRPDLKLARINLARVIQEWEGKDVTDFFIHPFLAYGKKG